LKEKNVATPFRGDENKICNPRLLTGVIFDGERNVFATCVEMNLQKIV
jgi:hypothetical protein